MLELHNVKIKPSNVKKRESKGTTKCDKRIVTCDVGTTQCEDRIVKCGKNIRHSLNLTKDCHV